MPNMSLKKNPMPSQDPKVRAHNYSEVALGYTEEISSGSWTLSGTGNT